MMDETLNLLKPAHKGLVACIKGKPIIIVYSDLTPTSIIAAIT